MPSPLPDSISATLRSDSTAALAALMVIAGAHAELFAWAARMVPGAAPAKAPIPPPKPKRDAGEPQGASRKPSNGADAYLALRREARDRDDESLLKAMRETPTSPIGDWAATIGKSRSSVISALHRLRDAGLVESVEGKWTLAGTDEPESPREPAPRWVAPLHASREQRATA